MFDGSIYKRCACKEPALDATGAPVLDGNGKPKTRQIGSDCKLLKRSNHGSWYYYVKLPDGPGGKRRRPRKGGFSSQEEAKKEGQKLWDEDRAGQDVDSKETVAQYLRRWFSKRVDLKRSTRSDYHDILEKVFIPALGHLLMRDLRTRHVQEVFAGIWAENELRENNRIAAQQAKAACEAAHKAWRHASKPRPPGLRERWYTARAALKEARTKPRQDTGPGRQLKFLKTLSGALKAAVVEKLITENWCDAVVLPTYERPEALVWTDARVARWKETGEKPSPVMVWTPEQTGRFLDEVVEHPLYPMWHLQVFRGTRRGESCGLPWTETDLTTGIIRVAEQLVTDSSYEVWEDTPKSRSGKRALRLDSATHQLLVAVREYQQARRAEHEKAGTWVNSGRVFTQDNGEPYHPDYVSQVFDRIIKRLGLPPIRLHDLRHCAASLSLASGLSMKAIQVLLGHSSYSLTADTYTSLMPQFEQAAADAPLALVPRQSADAQSPEPDKPRLALVPTDPDPVPTGPVAVPTEEAAVLTGVAA
ncbi:tyrosine-type recombinase/integrase [Streptomyces olivoreticuli]